MSKRPKVIEFITPQVLGEIAQKIAYTLNRNGYDADSEPEFSGCCLVSVTKGSGLSKFFGLAEGYTISLNRYNEKCILKVTDDWFSQNWLCIIGGFLLIIPFIAGLVGIMAMEKKMKQVFNLVARESQNMQATNNSQTLR